MTALAAVVVVALREVGLVARSWLVVGLVVGALALEPVWQNLRFGQVNLVLMAAVVVDLTRPERRSSGVLVGLAAGVKLTPLVFVVLLVLVGRRGAAGRATLTFLATVAVGFALVARRCRVVLDAGAARRRPRRPAVAGAQPVGVRRPHPTARRTAAGAPLGRRHAAPRRRGAARRRYVVAPW